MRTGFCLTGEHDNVRIHLLGRPTFPLLSFHRTGRVMAVLLGRLHYRRDLVRTLSGRCGSRERASDAGLVLAAYRQGGPDALGRLEGCFALAVWDADERQVYARRDLLGGFPLYWSRRGSRLAVGTGLQPVREWTGADTLDPEYEADYLMLPSCGENEVASERTPYRRVSRLLPQTLLATNLATGRTQVRRYYDWLDRLEVPATTDLADLGARYRELLTDAVRDRMTGPTAAHVSGGLDSTAVAYLAAAEIARGAAEGPLHTISLVYDSMTVLAQERAVIEGAVHGHPNMVPHLIAADGLLDFGPYAEPPAHDEPWPWLGAAGTEMARVEEAHRAGVTTVLTGQGADEFLDLGPYHLTDLLRRGRPFRAWREACDVAHAENCGTWPILFPFGLRNLIPLALRDGPAPFCNGGFADWLRLGEFTIPPWVRRDYARRLGLRDRAMARARQHSRPGRPYLLSVALDKITSRSGDLGRWYLSAPRGILVEHPFLDPRLIRFLLGVHAHMPPQPRRVAKPILVEAMKGILPDRIRLRSKAGFFNEPYFRGISRHAAGLERLLLSADSPRPDWLDRDVLASCLRQSALGIGNDRAQMDRLNVTLSWLRWLSGRGGGPRELTEVAALQPAVC